ncbi:MAG TPA: hypothetical protein DIV54_00475, partial [Verrucomicrobiales bacterium]|nr:hypothetical protein [Verrucomicrobiales bacterium]
MAKADFDRDGDVDLIITNYKSRAHYYVNQV